jgi:hypothetical protein
MLINPFLRSLLFETASDAGAGNGGGGNSGAGNEGNPDGGGDAGAGAPGGGGSADAGGSGSSSGNAGEFDFRTVVDAKGEFVEGWQNRLPADFDPYKGMLANHKTFSGMAKALADNMAAARTKTEGMVRVPGADAKPEERAAFFKAMGVPEKPEDYGLKAPEKMPEGIEWDPAFAGEFTKVAHAIGLTKEQVAKLAEFQLTQQSQAMQKADTEGAQAFEAEVAKLRQTFGENYEKRTIDAKRVAATVGLPDDHPVFWRADTVIAMAKMADLISEDRLITGEQATNRLSPETQAKDIVTNPDNPDYKAYYDPTHGRHKEVVAFVNQQFARSAGTKK